MALALLDLLALESTAARARIDTGTNRYYQVKVGTAVREHGGIEWLDDVVFASKVEENDRGGDPLSSAREVKVPVPPASGTPAFMQLLTFKTRDGKSPAVSRVVRIDAGFAVDDPMAHASSLWTSTSMPTAPNLEPSFAPARRVPCRTATETYVHQASLADLLAEAVKTAAPLVTRLMASANGAAPTATGTTGTANGAAGTSTGGPSAIDAVALLLKTMLAVLPQPAAQTQSVGGGRFAQPFIFGVDDALIAAAIGPVLEILPKLMNSANQHRLQMKQANNALVSNVVSEVQRRMLMDRLVEAQRSQAGDAQQHDREKLAQLIALLASAEPGSAAAAAAPALLAAAPTPVAPLPAIPAITPLPALPAMTSSLSASSAPARQVSARAVLSFVLADPIPWNGNPTAVFAKGHPLQLKVRLDVAAPLPKRPLPKAILTVAFKSSADHTVWFEKTFRLTDLAPNIDVPCDFTADEVSRVPVNQSCAVVAELRWPGVRGGAARSALGSAELVLIDKYAVTGAAVSMPQERELSDMQRFRPFWNKVWESPSLDAARDTQGPRKKLWSLDVNARYSVLLAPEHEANGLMDTKLLRAASDANSVTERIDGRMKAGIELSVAELNKLLMLFDQQSLERPQLDALATSAFARGHAGEVIHRLTLKGKARERGLIWVIPVFQLFDVPLMAVKTVNEGGQVLSVSNDTVKFPLPVACRLLGLLSDSTADDDADEDSEGADSSSGGDGYQFDGFSVAFSHKVALTPVA